MSEHVTTENRIRGRSNAIRSDIIRVRVQDIIGGQLGGRNGERAQVNARETFAHTAVRVASLNEMRTWSDNTFPREVGAMSSLRVLLGEKKMPSKGRIYTGVNDGWVLDIWEATCNHYSRSSIFNSPTVCEPMSKLTDDDVISLNGSGPKFIVEPAKAKPLSMSVLEAYIARDDEKMMQLVINIENLEGRDHK